MTTGASGTFIETKYQGEPARYEMETSLLAAGFDWSLGMTESVLLDPIDYEAELAERRETHEAIAPVDGDVGNSLFGI
jgi:hypothetical protein